LAAEVPGLHGGEGVQHGPHNTLPTAKFPAPGQKSKVALSDLIVILSVLLLVFGLATYSEFFERVIHWTRPFELWQIDELPLTLLVLTIGLAWFSYRRWKESQQEVLAKEQAEREIMGLLQQIRLLSRQLITLQEQERRELTRELHDELGQSLNAIKVEATSIRNHSQRVPEILASAEAVISVASHVHEVIRSMMRRLRPSALDDLGLLVTLQDHIELWGQRHSITCTFLPKGELDDLGEISNITIYRLVQESLTNIAKHAEAQHVIVRLSRCAGSPLQQRLEQQGDGTAVSASDFIELVIEDDGKGMDVQGAYEGIGIIGMNERVQALGGLMTMDSAAGQGLSINIVLPVERQ
jgi:signal transduction histidine kinase